MPLHIIHDDIIHVSCDAIVNPTDVELSGSGGVDRHIQHAAGRNLRIEKRKIGFCAEGNAVITKGYHLPCRYIIHTVGPRWKGGKSGEQEILRSCYRESLKLAVEYGCTSVAFPLIASGTFGYPKELALQAAIQEISFFCLINEILVYLVVFDKDSYQISTNLFASEHTTSENPNICTSASVKSPDFLVSNRDTVPIPFDISEIKERLMHTEETFSQMLLRKITETGIRDSDCYRRANIDRRLFSRIRTNNNYKPKKHTALAFAIALKLTLEETQELLAKAGFVLCESEPFDIIVKFFIEHRCYNIHEINAVLFDYDLKLLGDAIK